MSKINTGRENRKIYQMYAHCILVVKKFIEMKYLCCSSNANSAVSVLSTVYSILRAYSYSYRSYY